MQSLLYLATPFALISSYSTPFELAHALKLAKVTTVFVQARLFPLVLSQAKEAGLSRKKIFILEGVSEAASRFPIWYLMSRSIYLFMRTRFVLHARIHWRILFSLVAPVAYLRVMWLVTFCILPHAHKRFAAVMITHGNLVYSIYQVFVMGKAEVRVSPVGLLFSSRIYNELSSARWHAGRHTNNPCIPSYAPQLWPARILLPILYSPPHVYHISEVEPSGRYESYTQVRKITTSHD